MALKKTTRQSNRERWMTKATAVDRAKKVISIPRPLHASEDEHGHTPPTEAEQTGWVAVLAEPEHDAGEEWDHVAVGVLRIVRPTANHLVDGRPVRPAQRQKQRDRRSCGTEPLVR